jgi:hypothetical protein
LACAVLVAGAAAPSAGWGEPARLPPTQFAPPPLTQQSEFPGGTTAAPGDTLYAGPCAPSTSFQWMPDELIYHSYMAGVKEPRFASVWSSEKDFGLVWDVALGGRVGVLRWETSGPGCTSACQVDLEGAVFPRLDPNAYSTPLIAADFRAGVPVTYGRGPLHVKIAYYHISSHLGDEFLLLNPDFPRINYSRDAVVIGGGYYCTDALRLYGEVGYALSAVGGAEPWELQFGADFSPPHTPDYGSPFAAVNAHLRQDVGFGGHFVAQAGWQFRQGGNGRLLRLGLQYFNGKNEQYEFLNDFEHKLGGGIWFDY